MSQSTGTANWIGAYLEWTDAGSFTGAREHAGFSGAEAAGADPAEEYTAAYLEWMDAAPPVRERRTQYRARDARDGDAAAQPMLDRAIAYSRGVYEIATQTQEEMSKFAEAQASEFNNYIIGYLDRIAKNAPAGSDVAIAAAKSALAAANSAYDSISRVAKQASELAETNFVAATTVPKDARKKAA